MAILFFDNFKFDNTNTTFPADGWGVFTSKGDVNTNSTYTKNGYSNNGLDLSITSSNASKGYHYVSKNGIGIGSSILTNGVICKNSVGFHIDQYEYSGSDVLDSQLAADMSIYGSGTFRAAFSGDGQYLVTLRWVSASSSIIVEYHKRNSDGTFGTAITLKTITGATNTSFNNVVFSSDGYYLMIVTAISVYLYKRPIGSNTFTSIAFTSPSNITSASFTGNDNIVISSAASPYIYFYGRTIDTDTWTQAANPTSLPTGTITNLAGNGGTNYVVGLSSSAPYAYVYYYSGTGQAILQSLNITLTTKPSCVDISAFSKIALGYTASPYLQIINTNGSSISTIDTPPLISVSNVSFSPDGLTLSVNTNTTTNYTYRLSANALATVTQITNTLPSIRILTTNYSSDSNFMALTSSTSPYIYTYDRRVNCLAILGTTDSGSILSDNYSYVGSSRASILKKDDVLMLRYYDSVNGVVITTKGLDAAYCVTDSNFTDSYIQMQITKGSNVGYCYLYANNKVQSAASAVVYGMLPTTAFDLMVNGPISLTFKRDINTSSQKTLTYNVTDVYITDGTGMDNNSVLGTVTVVSEPLMSDNSISWSSTGANSYGVLASQTPDMSSYVYTNISGASDIIDVDTSSETSNLYATKIAAIARLSGPSNDGLVLSDTFYGQSSALSTTFSEVDFTYEPFYNYVATAQSSTSSAPFTIRRLDLTTQTSSLLTINGAITGVSGSCIALSPDAMYAVGGYSASPYVQLFKNTPIDAIPYDNYNLVSGAFPEVTSAVLFTEFSPDGTFVAISTSSMTYIYKNTSGTFSLIGSIGFGTPSAIKISKGSKYIFLGSTTNGSSRVISVNTSTNSVTVLSKVTESYTSIDTGASPDGSIEYVALGKAVTPYISMYYFKNDDSFTASTTYVSAGSITSPPTFVSLPRGGVQNTYAYIVYDQGGTTTYRSQFVVSTSTLSAQSANTFILPSAIKDVDTLNNNTVVFATTSGAVYLQYYSSFLFGSAAFSYPMLANGLTSIKNISVVPVFRYNTNKVEYKHS